jgi:hypothetical protein
MGDHSWGEPRRKATTTPANPANATAICAAKPRASPGSIVIVFIRSDESWPAVRSHRYAAVSRLLVRFDHVASLIVSANHCGRRSLSFEAKLLSAPWQDFSRKNGFVFIQRNLVGIEMPTHVRFRSIQYAYDLAFMVDFQNAARDRVTHVDKMIPGDEEAVRMSHFPESNSISGCLPRWNT